MTAPRIIVVDIGNTDMKKILLLTVLALLTGALRADYAQKMPDFGKDRAGVRTLVDVTAIEVLPDGVVATYKLIFSGVGKEWRTPAGRCEENPNGQMIFISGLDHRIVTDRCFLFHRNYSGHYLLFARTAGVASVEIGGKALRLRKYTVDPKPARFSIED